MNLNNTDNKDISSHNGKSMDMPMLNDEDIEKMLHPNGLFPDEIITPSNKDSTSPSNIDADAIIDTSATTNDNLTWNKSLALRKEPVTDIIRRARSKVPVGLYPQSIPNELLSSNIIIDNLSTPAPDVSFQNQPITRRYQSQKTRPAFVNKLWNMLSDEANLKLIQWTDDGNSFIVTNREDFVHQILPKYFKHSNFASFVRQLNMYGWHKVQDVKSGSIQNSSDDRWQFENPNFIKDREDLLVNIVRQKGPSHPNQNNKNNANITNSTGDMSNDVRPTLHLMNEPSTYNELNMSKDVSTVLNELDKIKYNQIAISKDLLRMNKDNELLWKENLMARERHRTQQQTLEKIFRFLTSMVPHMDQKMLTDGILNFNKNSSTNDNTNNSNFDTNNDANSNHNNRINEDNSIFDDVIHNNKKSQTSKNNVGDNFYSSNIRHTNNYDSPRAEFYNEIANELHDRSTVNDINNHNSNIDTNNNFDYLNRPPTKARLLLKNRSHSSSSTTLPTVSPGILNRDSKISEIPFDEDDSIHRSDSHSVIDDFTNSKFKGVRPVADNDKFLDSIQSNIDEQDIRIQHLEDMVKGLSPSKDKIGDQRDGNNSFSLQDYFTGDANNTINHTDDSVMLHPSDPTGLTPLIYDENSLLYGGEGQVQIDGNKRYVEEITDHIPLVEIDDKSVYDQHDQIDRDAALKIEELSPEPNAKRPKFK